MGSGKRCKYYEGIDGLRVFSAIGIVLMHILASGHYLLDGFFFKKIIPSFVNLVFLFMIISGFAMCCGYYDKILNHKITITEFYSKRYIKIWPFFALLCLLDFLVSPGIEPFYETFANLTLCFGFLEKPMSVIGVGWFLGLVFIFYLVFPFYCFLLSDKRRAWVSFGISVIFNLTCSGYFKIGRENFLYSSVFFLAGGLIFLYRECLEKLARQYRWLIIAISAAFMVGYYVFGSSVVLMLILFSLLLIHALGIRGGGGITETVTKFLSSNSMEIYLCHMMIFRAIEKLGCTHLFSSDLLSYVVVSVGTLVGAIMFSVVTKSCFQWVWRKKAGKENDGN